MGPVDRAQAHGTGFAGGIELTAREVVGFQLLCSLPDNQYFGVGRWIVHAGNPVPGPGNDLPVLYQQGGKRSAPGIDILARHLQRTTHKLFIRFPVSCHGFLLLSLPEPWSARRKNSFPGSCFSLLFVVFSLLPAGKNDPGIMSSRPPPGPHSVSATANPAQR